MTNDTAIMIGLFSFFILLGAIVPLAQEAFDQDVEEYNIEGIEDELSQEASGISAVTLGFNMIFSIISMFVWNIGGLPFIFNVIFLIPRFIFWFILVRVARGIG